MDILAVMCVCPAEGVIHALFEGFIQPQALEARECGLSGMGQGQDSRDIRSSWRKGQSPKKSVVAGIGIRDSGG